MSFDVNVLSSQPVIKAAANMQNDGGAGNLGYMGRGRRKKKDNHKDLFDENIVDTFGNSDMFAQDFNIEVKFTLKDFFRELFDAFMKAFFRK